MSLPIRAPTAAANGGRMWPTSLRRAGRAGQRGQLERVRQTGGCLTGPNPTDRGKPGSKYHLLVDRRGIPLAAGLSAANTRDSMLLEPMVDAVPRSRAAWAAAQAPGQAALRQGATTTRAGVWRCAGAA
jgi:hypothetical protein